MGSYWWESSVGHILVLGLHIDVVQNAVESIDLLSSSLRSVLSKNLVGMIPDELLLIHLLTLHAGRRRGREVVRTQVRLELLQEYQHQSHLVLLLQVLDWGVLAKQKVMKKALTFSQG